MFGQAFYVLKGVDSATEVRHVDMVKLSVLLFEVEADLLGLFATSFGEHAWLLAADGAFDVVFGLAVTGEDKSNSGNVFLHVYKRLSG